MAPVKKDLMHVIVDVSPTMHGDLPAIGHSLASLFHKLLLFEKPGKVVASIYMSGSNGCCAPASALRAPHSFTAGTDNALADAEPDQYQHQQARNTARAA